jgi:hypothetical protein
VFEGDEVEIGGEKGGEKVKRVESERGARRERRPVLQRMQYGVV